MRVLLVPNTANPLAVSAAIELATWLSATGIEPVLITADAEACELGAHGIAPSAVGEPTLTVALGGDGTILKAVHTLGRVEAPVLGVNLGRLGFMSGARAEMLRESVGSALAGEGRIERRSTLEATVRMGGRDVGRYRALNEVHVGRGTTMRVIDLELSVNGTMMTRIRCDGMVVATPTGSTAYALSAGGPIVAPDVPCAVVVPVAAHTLAARSIVVGSSDRVDLVLPNPARRDALVSVDGALAPCRRDVESISVVRAEHDVLLVKLDGRDFYEVVRDEFLRGQ